MLAYEVLNIKLAFLHSQVILQDLWLLGSLAEVRGQVAFCFVHCPAPGSGGGVSEGDDDTGWGGQTGAGKLPYLN